MRDKKQQIYALTKIYPQAQNSTTHKGSAVYNPFKHGYKTGSVKATLYIYRMSTADTGTCHR